MTAILVYSEQQDTARELIAAARELGPQLGQAFFGDVLGSVVHRGRLPFSSVRYTPEKLRDLAARDKEKNSRRTALDALKFDRRVS